MFNKNKNMIVGERSKLFAVSLLRFLISPTFWDVIASEAKQSLQGCRLLRFARNDVFYCTLFLFSFLSLRAEYRSGNELNGVGDDSLKTKYDINDPRNPHCPCHKYQKLADEEFAKMQKKEENKKGYETNNGTSSDTYVSKRHRISSTRFKRKKSNKKLVKVRMVFSKEYWRRWRASTDVANCFHW